jgi:hypothetical protein
MKKICAWCTKELETMQDPSTRDLTGKISHGICYDCANKLYKDIGVKLGSFLERIVAPVVIVSETGKIKTANKLAQEFLNKGLTDIEGNYGGVVFECAYSKLPEGCGKTIHCSGCTIRNTVMDTFNSGKGQINVPASLNVGDTENPQKIDLLISTEKANDVVLLRIDKFGNEKLAQPVHEE